MKKYLFLSVILIAAFMLMISCTMPDINNLGLPTWTTTFQLYILNDSWSISELADESDDLFVVGDTLYIRKTESETIELNFITASIEDRDYVEIGDIEIRNPEPKEVFFSLVSFAPELEHEVDEPIIVDSFTLSEVEKSLDPYSEFEEIVIASGELYLTLSNNSPVWLGNVEAGEPLTFGLFAENINEPIIELLFEEDIEPISGYREIVIPLAGESLPNEMSVVISGGSRGSDGEIVTIDLDTGLSLTLDFEDIRAEYAKAAVSEQTIEDHYDIDLNLDQIIIYYAELTDKEMYCRIDIRNDIDLDMIVDLTIDQLRAPGQETDYEFSFFLKQNSTFSKILDLNGFSIGRGEPIEFLQANIKLTTIDTGDEVRTLYATDGLQISTEIDDLYFDYVSGIIKPQVQDTFEDFFEFDFEFPDLEGELALTGLSELIFTFETPIPASISVELMAENNKGESVQLVAYEDNLPPTIYIESGYSSVTISSADYNLNELLSIIPDRIEYRITPTVGDENELFEFYRTDNLQVNFELITDINFAADCWLVPIKNGKPDANLINTEDFDESIYDAFRNASLTLYYKNFTGLEMGADIVISNRELNDFDEVHRPDLSSVSVIKIPRLETTADVYRELSITIKQQDLKYLLADSVYVIPRLRMVSSESDALSGEVHLSALIKVEAEISSSLTD